MRDKRIEAKLMTIGKRYHQKMWIESINQHNVMMITPKKPMQIRTLTQKDQIRQDITMQNVNRTRQHQNTISRCLNFNTVIPAEEKEEKEMCTQLRMSLQDEVEDVIYSEGASRLSCPNVLCVN